MQKITWNKIRDQFKRTHPARHKQVIYWRPHEFGTIMLYFKDGRKGTYNYDTRKLTMLIETWTHE